MSKETQGLVFKRSNESYSSFDDQIISCLQVCCLHDIIINDTGPQESIQRLSKVMNSKEVSLIFKYQLSFK